MLSLSPLVRDLTLIRVGMIKVDMFAAIAIGYITSSCHSGSRSDCGSNMAAPLDRLIEGNRLQSHCLFELTVQNEASLRDNASVTPNMTSWYPWNAEIISLSNSMVSTQVLLINC